MQDLPFPRLFAIMGFILVIAFVLARSQRPGRETRLGLGLIALGVAEFALLVTRADLYDDWAHLRDVLMFRSAPDRLSAGVLYLAFVAGAGILIYGIGKRR